MSQAEELLNTLSAGSDTGVEGHIVIDSNRNITVPKELRRIAVQFDHNVETATFDCPRFWDGLDMSKMTVYINYFRADRGRGKFEAKNVTIDGEDPTIMHFDWTLTKVATMVKGPLKFLVCIVKTDDNGNEEHHWNSELCDQMYISEGLETGPAVVDMHADVITDLLVRMDKILIANSPILDTGLTQRGLAADAKATGDAITQTRSELLTEVRTVSNAVRNETAARKSEIAVERKRINQIITLQDGSTTGDIELADARISADGVTFDTVGDANRTQFEQLFSTIDNIIVENIYDPSVQTAETITENAFIQAGSEKAHNNYFITGPIDVSRFRGKKLYFNKTLYGSAVEAARVSSFDSSGRYITCEGLDGLEYSVPANASYIKLTVYRDIHASIDGVNKNFMILTSNVSTTLFPYGYKSLLPEPSYEKLPKMAINVSNNVINVTAPSGSGYLHYVFEYFKGSKNAFFDFGSIGFTSERTAFPSQEEILFINGSDFFGPYIVKAVKEIDGDMPDSLNFTGASHAYSGNTESSTSATGVSAVDQILVDGKAYTSFNGYCDTFDVYWTNYVQATNTKKEDGSGRAVLKENYHLHFDGEKFEIENDVTALEDLTIVRYYGLQMSRPNSSSAYDISYVGSHTNIVAITGNSNSYDNHCSEIYIRRLDAPVECRFGVHPIGLGTFYCNNSYSAFDTDYGKSYFYMINSDTPCQMTEYQQINFKGYYKFRYCD